MITNPRAITTDDVQTDAIRCLAVDTLQDGVGSAVDGVRHESVDAYIAAHCEAQAALGRNIISGQELADLNPGFFAAIAYAHMPLCVLEIGPIETRENAIFARINGALLGEYQPAGSGPWPNDSPIIGLAIPGNATRLRYLRVRGLRMIAY